MDTEWADAQGQQLVSMALVDAGGQNRFYSGFYPLPLGSTAFVREVVYPLLAGGPAMRSAPEFTLQLRRFLEALNEPRLVLADHPNDFVLLSRALQGFGNEVAGEVPTWKAILVTQGDVLMQIETYFERNPVMRQRRHHAGIDAEALRWAFESVIAGIGR